MDFNVVVVDDAPVNVKLMSYLTERLEDCTAIGFTSAPEALAWCEKSEPDLLLVDFMMPELDGIEFLRRFRALPARAEVPFLMITANGDVSVRHAALQQGANDFLTKPIDRTEFMARARNMLSMRRSQRALADRADWLAGEVRRATADILSRERETVLREQSDLLATREQTELRAKLERESATRAAQLEALGKDASARAAAAQTLHQEEVEHLTRVRQLEIALIEAQSRAVVADRTAVQPQLVEALTALGDKALLTEVAQNMNLISLFRGKEAGEILKEVVGGTRFAPALQEALSSSRPPAPPKK